jgi:hypothetical protein
MNIHLLWLTLFFVACGGTKNANSVYSNLVHTKIDASCFKYASAMDSFDGVLVYHHCAVIACGTLGGGVSLSLIRVNDLDTVRVLDLCNTCGNGRRFKIRDSIRVSPYDRPGSATGNFLPQPLTRDGRLSSLPVDPSNCRFLTFYGELYNLTEAAIIERFKKEETKKLKAFQQPITPRQIKNALKGEWKFIFSTSKTGDTCSAYRRNISIQFTQGNLVWSDNGRMVKGRWKIQDRNLIVIDSKSNVDSSGSIRKTFIQPVPNSSIRIEFIDRHLIFRAKETVETCGDYYFIKRNKKSERQLKRRLDN